MTWVVDSNATSSALTIGSEYIADSPTTNATYVFEVDMVNVANGDLVELRCYDMVDAVNFRQAWKGTYGNVQVNNAKYSPPLAVTTQSKYTIRQAGGSFTFSTLVGGSNISNGATMKGQTSSAVATLYTFGGAAMSTTTAASGTITMVLTSTSGFVGFSANEVVQISTGSSTSGIFTLTSITGRTYPWSVRRI